MRRIRKTITIPEDLVNWAEKEVREGKYPGIRSLSGFVEYLLRKEKGKVKESHPEGVTKNMIKEQ